MAQRRDSKKETAWQRSEKSRLTIARFCRHEAVSEASFYYWRKRLKDNRHVEPTRLFVPLNVANHESDVRESD